MSWWGPSFVYDGRGKLFDDHAASEGEAPALCVTDDSRRRRWS
jgi:hypothetical protein